MITLKVSHEEEAVLAEDTIDLNIDSLREYFKDDTIEKIEFKVIATDYLDRRTLQPLEYEDEPLPLELMAADIRNEKSFLFKEMTKLYKSDDVVQDKISMLRYLLKCYVSCNFNLSNRMNDNGYRYFASKYYGMCYFKYVLPLRLAADDVVDLRKLSTEDLSNYIIPCYYREIGWRDRKDIRNNKALMAKLAESWLDKAKYGSPD